MSFELTQAESNSYQEKYDKIIKAKLQLNFTQTKKLIIGQFSITDSQASSILNKVFATQQGDVMNKQGFFTTLRYIQCLQNGVNIDTCNINTIKLNFPLKVNSKKKLRNSFQPPSVDDPLEKSMIALNQIQSLIKVEQPKPALKVEDPKPVEEQQVVSQISDKEPEVNQQNIEIPIEDEQSASGLKKEVIVEPEQQKGIKSEKIEKFGDVRMSTAIDLTHKLSSPNSSTEIKEQIQQQTPPPRQSNPQPTQDIIEISDEEDAIEQPTNELCLWISDYELKKDSQFTQGYYVYTVCSEIMMDKESKKITKYIVKRRYTDFKMLQQYFAETKQGDLIPSLPEKEGLIGNLYNLLRENTQKLNERVEQLQLFLRELIKYKEDQILISFLTIDQTFESILNTLRYQKSDIQDDDVFLPNPEDYKVKEKIKRIISFQGYQTLLFDYLKGSSQIEAKFQEEYRQAQQHYKNLENKKQELVSFESEYLKFYEPYEKFSFPPNFTPLSIVGEKNIAEAQLMQQIQNQLQNKKGNVVIDQVKQIKFKLDSLTYSYQYIDKQIYKWFAEKQRLRQGKTTNKKQIEQNDTEEGRLQFVISKTNDSLIKLVQQISLDLQNLLNDFVDDLTMN